MLLSLTHFSSFSIPPETKGFLTFSEGIEMEHWAKMGFNHFVSIFPFDTFPLLSSR